MSGSVRPIPRIVFHADDFGMNTVVNDGIMDSFRRGILTSTSLLANAPAAAQACQQWRPLLRDLAANALESSAVRRVLSDPTLPFDLGVHVNLTQGRPLSSNRYPAELLNERGEFPGIGKTFVRLRRTSRAQQTLVREELQSQIEWMCDHGLKPSHLNGHQYVELLPPIAEMIPELLARYEIPVCRVAREPGLMETVLAKGRLPEWGVGQIKRFYANRFFHRMQGSSIGHPDQFFGTSHAGKIDLATMATFVRRSSTVRRSNQAATSEVGIHPGAPPTTDAAVADNPWFDPLQDWRAAERDLLCSTELRDLLINQGVTLGRLQLLASPAP